MRMLVGIFVVINTVFFLYNLAIMYTVINLNVLKLQTCSRNLVGNIVQVMARDILDKEIISLEEIITPSCFMDTMG
ncbi:hypothetical protein [Enterococcus rotai]|uniref:hypothetical protein n=1 Tax=Enterococcus rotai TaxID=118060 RepID=UPI0032B4F6D3